MSGGLLSEVVVGLKTRKGEWMRIADDLKPDVSYSMIEKIGGERYESSPTIGKLEKIAGWLRTHPQEATA